MHTDNTPSPLRLPIFLAKFDVNGDGHLSSKEIKRILELSPEELTPIQEDTAYLVIQEILAAAKIAKEKLVPTQGVSYDEFRILGMLYTGDTLAKKSGSEFFGFTQLAISNETNLKSSTVSSILDKIDAGRVSVDATVKPWITRTENPQNRREKLVSLTHEGKANFRLARKDYNKQILKSLLSNLSFNQLLGTWETLYRFNVSLDPTHTSTSLDYSSDDSGIKPQI